MQNDIYRRGRCSIAEAQNDVECCERMTFYLLFVDELDIVDLTNKIALDLSFSSLWFIKHMVA